MLYRILCSFNDDFGLCVFFVYLAAFALAFVLIFIFPPGALALVMLGILGFVGIWVVVACSKMLERSICRRQLAAGCCPFCSGELLVPGDTGQNEHATCSRCGQAFERDGRRHDLDDEEDDDDLPTV
jgi:hypothetical protein